MSKINLYMGNPSTLSSEELYNLLSTDEPISDTNLYRQNEKSVRTDVWTKRERIEFRAYSGTISLLD